METDVGEFIRGNRFVLDLLEKVEQQSIQIEELTNQVAALKEENQLLKDEIAILKKQKPRPKIRPSNLEGPKSGGKGTNPNPSRGKHPRKKKKGKIPIHDEKVVHPESIPEGAIFKGYKYIEVQDLEIRAHNTLYKLARYQLPDGSYITGKVPNSVCDQYGFNLVSYILHQYFVCQVPQLKILEQLRAYGLSISAGKLNNIINNNNEVFHKEKEGLLAAGIRADGQIQADDTGARHKGKNQYTTVIGNKYFTIFVTTPSKSRSNFLRSLQNGEHHYLINEDTIAYLKEVNASDHLPGYISLSNGLRFDSEKSWKEFLKKRNITGKNEVRFATEAAIFASLIERGIPKDLVVHGDDAGQFDCFVRALCWIHEERHYRKIILTTEQGKADLERVIGEIWEFYNKLKEYKLSPANEEELKKQFDKIFLQTTSSPTLNKRLRQTHKKKEQLLRVLERPKTPLHNNSSETDARSVVTKRKVSGGTRSDSGRDSRDTFLSLKQTCRKLGLNFLDYVKDRVRGLFEIPPLAELIYLRAMAAESI